MWALVESGSVTAVYKFPKAITIGGIQHPKEIFTRWSAEDKKALGIYEYIESGANPDSRFYITGAESIAVDDSAGTVTKTWAQVDKALADSTEQTQSKNSDGELLWTDDDNGDADIVAGDMVEDGNYTPKMENVLDENGDTIPVYGLKTNAKNQAKSQAGSLLASSDWYAIRAAEGGTAVPSAVATYRAAVRTKSGSIESSIDGASDMAAFVALHTATFNSDGEMTAEAAVNDWPAVPDVLA